MQTNQEHNQEHITQEPVGASEPSASLASPQASPVASTTPLPTPSSSLERRIEIIVPMDELEKDVEKRLKKIAGTVKMDGFRPGKVPLKLLAAQYGNQARVEVMNETVEKTFKQIISEQDLKVAGYPKIESKGWQPEETHVTFTAVFEVYPEIHLGDLSAKEIKCDELDVGEDDLNKTIDIIRNQHAVFVHVERPAMATDRVTVDYTGRLEGEIFQGGQATDSVIILGEGAMLPEFETPIVGMSVGETKIFDLVFPGDYHSSDMAGKQVSFELTLKSVEERQLPDMDEAFARSMDIADGDINKLKETIKSNLKREVTKRLKMRTKDQVMEALLEINPIEVPQALVYEEARHMAESLQKEWASQGRAVKDIPINPSWFNDSAKRRVQLGLILSELVKVHSLQAQPEQIRSMIEDIAQVYDEPEKIIQWYYSQSHMLAGVEALVIENNVVSWVLDHARISSKPISFEALIGNGA